MNFLRSANTKGLMINKKTNTIFNGSLGRNTAGKENPITFSSLSYMSYDLLGYGYGVIV